VAAPARAETVVDTCGQVLAGNGHLVADLDCSGFPGAAVTLQYHARLDLRGHTLTADFAVDLADVRSRFYVESDPPGGRLQGTGAAGNGIGDVREGRLFVSGVIVSGFGGNGVVADSLTVTDSTVSDNAGDGVFTRDKLKIIGSDIGGNGDAGIQAFASRKVLIVDSTVTGNAGVGAHVVNNGFKLKAVIISGNGSDGILSDYGGHGIRIDGLAGRRLNVIRSDVSDNAGAGIYNYERVKVKSSTVDGNGESGIWQMLSAPVPAGCRRVPSARIAGSMIRDNGLYGVEITTPCGGKKVRLSLSHSQLTGNGTDSECGVSLVCADIGSKDEPKVDSDSVCDVSYELGSGFPGSSWNVCAAD
jgi:hypothetical protein